MDEQESTGVKRKVKVENGSNVLMEEGMKYEVDEYINHYSCKPPTLFIPLITLFQVRHSHYISAQKHTKT